MPLRITTWNVNGIRNPFGYEPWRNTRTFNGMFDILEADIVIMQELKIQRKDLRDDMVLVPGWDCYFSLPKHKKGYSGVGIYTRQSVCAPIRAEEGLLGVLSPPGSSVAYRDRPEDQSIGGYPTALQLAQLAEIGVDPAALDSEGRCMILEFPAFVLFGLYSPANSNGLRDDFRYGFLSALDFRIRNLVKMGKRVVVTGDLNVSRQFIDTAAAEQHLKEGSTEEDYVSTPGRRLFNQLLEGGKVVGERDEGREEPVLWDICRGFHEGRKGMYTHWEVKVNARPGNYGSRIDFVLCSLDMKSWVFDSNIQEGLMGSDHCPVYAILKDEVLMDDKPTKLLDIMNPPGMFKNGERQREYCTKDLLPLSGKLLPEFDRRRSIKDMFTKRPSQPKVKDRPPLPPTTPGASNSQASTTSEGEKSESASQANSSVSTMDNASSATARENSTTSSSTAGQKRRGKAAAASPISKRSKSAISASNSTSKNGQQSLKGFFKPRTPAAPPGEASSDTPKDGLPLKDNDVPEEPPSPSLRRASSSKVDSPTNDAEPEYVIDQVASKETWGKLFTKPNAPKCECHAEPCISYTTKKNGMNRGRSFWVCPRPLGPSGQKERGTEWRCPTFIWASDWNSSTES